MRHVSSNMRKNIVIFGATGGTGRQLVTQALDQDFDVTAFVRDPARLDVSHPALAVTQGDVLNPEDVEKAIQGQDAVLSALGVKPGRKPICTQGMMNILAAMKKHHVSRLVVESAYGTRDSQRGFYAQLLRMFLKPVMNDKDDMEKAIEHSHLEWIVVRPTILTDGHRTGTYRRGHDLTVNGFPKISRADVADCMVTLIHENSSLKQFLTLTY